MPFATIQLFRALFYTQNRHLCNFVLRWSFFGFYWSILIAKWQQYIIVMGCTPAVIPRHTVSITNRFIVRSGPVSSWPPGGGFLCTAINQRLSKPST